MQLKHADHEKFYESFPGTMLQYAQVYSVNSHLLYSKGSEGLHV